MLDGAARRSDAPETRRAGTLSRRVIEADDASRANIWTVEFLGRTLRDGPAKHVRVRKRIANTTMLAGNSRSAALTVSRVSAAVHETHGAVK